MLELDERGGDSLGCEHCVEGLRHGAQLIALGGAMGEQGVERGGVAQSRAVLQHQRGDVYSGIGACRVDRQRPRLSRHDPIEMRLGTGKLARHLT